MGLQMRSWLAWLGYHCLTAMVLGSLAGCSSSAAPPSAEQAAALEAQQFLFDGNADQAIESYTKAIGLNGNQPDYFLNRGIAYNLKLQPDKAMADLSKAIELNPSLAAAYFHRGKVNEGLGNAQQAKSDFETAERLAPSK